MDCKKRRSAAGGPEYLLILERDLRQWMEENGYASVRQMRGSLSLSTCPDP